MKAIPLIIAISANLAGCFPMHFTDFPGASGRVVSASTAQPISGAKVTVALRSPQNNSGPKTAVTDADGLFLITPDMHWGIYIMPMDFMGYFGKVTVSAAGYLPAERNIKSSPLGLESTAYGDLALEKQQ